MTGSDILQELNGGIFKSEVVWYVCIIRGSATVDFALCLSFFFLGVCFLWDRARPNTHRALGLAAAGTVRDGGGVLCHSITKENIDYLQVIKANPPLTPVVTCTYLLIDKPPHK